MTREEEKKLAVKYNAATFPDHKRGYNWNRYELNGWHIWATRRWVAARLVDDSYTDQKEFRTLEEAFEFASEKR